MLWTWTDLARTRRREDNRVQACLRWGRRVLPPEIYKNGDALIDEVLDPACPNWTMSSAYRSPALNAAVGGNVNSAHMVGLAADMEPPGPFADALRQLAAARLPLDRVIYEVRGKARWLHVQRRPLNASTTIATLWLHSPAPATYLQLPLDELAARAAKEEPK